MDDAQAQALMEEASRLRAQAEAVRAQLATEGDRYRRFRHYRELQEIGDNLAPLEQSLFEANRPSRIPAAQPANPSRS